MDMFTKEKISLLDLIDVEQLQELQDAFFEATGISAGFSDADGRAVTVHSSATGLCSNCIKCTEIGLTRCQECDAYGTKIAFNNNKVSIYECHAGLIDFAAPISVKGELIGCFLGGQVLTSPMSDEKIQILSKELGVDYEVFADYAKKVPVIERDRIEKFAQLMYTTANMMSQDAYHKYQMLKGTGLVEQAMGMNSDFLANMGHEIRTPMTAVIGMAEMALRENLPANARDYINQIVSSGNTLLSIINNVLDYSRIQSGKMPIRDEEYEFIAMIDEVVDSATSRLNGKTIEFLVDIDPTIPKILKGDIVHIKQVIVNLLNNSIQFTKEGKISLKVWGNKKDDKNIELVLAVEDTGIGIHKQDMNKLFTPNVQMTTKHEHNLDGAGLGLPITKHLIELMGGQIWVESKYEKGTTFTARIPQQIMSGSPCVVIDNPQALRCVGRIDNSLIAESLQHNMELLGISFQLCSEEQIMDLGSDKISFLFVEESCCSLGIIKYLENNSTVHGVALTELHSAMSAEQRAEMSNLTLVRRPFVVSSLARILNQTGKSKVDSDEADDYNFVCPEANILLVDDKPTNLSIARGMLEPYKINVDTLTSGADAMDQIILKKYDMILLDHMMPGMDGVETTQLIRQFHPEYQDVPIIVMTANAMAGTQEMFVNEGINDYIAKPIELKPLVKTLKKWLPKEKIIIQKKEDEKTAERKQSSIKIDELDTDTALQMLGSESLYLSALQGFYDSIETNVKKIRSLYQEKDWKNYTIELHSLKSAARQIGANELAEKAALLEAAGQVQSTELIRKRTGEMLTLYHHYRTVLKPFVDVEKEQPLSEVKKEVVPLSVLYQDMSDAFDRFDTKKMEQVIKKMQEENYDKTESELYNALCSAVKKLDVEECEAVLEKWEDMLW